MGLDLIQVGRNVVLRDSDHGTEEKFVCCELQKLQEKVCGVYGIIEYGGVQFLIVVNQASHSGNIGKHPVYEVKSIRVYTLGNKRQPVVVKHIENFFSLPGIFFSEYNLYERNSVCSVTYKNPLDNEFLFNRYPLSVYLKNHRNFGLRCIQGYFGGFRGIFLVSRRSSLRVGMRYFSRGCDANGNCSNFVETEQFIDGVSSYLQVRGSIPLFWSHLVSWWYNPIITFSKPFSKAGSQESGFSKALSKIRKVYKEKIIYLNLIKETGYEGALWRLFKKELKACVGYHYNFHKNAGVKPCPVNVNATGYSSPTTKQSSLIRTNCIDCLDRTNSMQYIIGREVLERQLREWENFGEDNQFRDEVMEAFRLLFYENGNYLSIQYSGTPALLGSHILKRKSYGKIMDGYFSVKRYLINRLVHGRLQNSYEILCGHKQNGSLHNVRRKCLSSAFGFAICVIFPNLLSSNNFVEFFFTLLIFFILFYMFLRSIIDLPF